MAQGKQKVQRLPGINFLRIGKNEEGWWTYEHLAAQIVAVMDVYECLWPDKQLLFEVDWSSGHAKMLADALHTPSMGKNFGGAQKAPRNTMVETVGDYSTTYKYKDRDLGNEVEVDVGLKVGDKQSFVHVESDPPPFLSVTHACPFGAPKHDIGDPSKKPRKKKKEKSGGSDNQHNNSLQVAAVAAKAQAVAQAEANAAAERVEAADIVAAQTPEQAEIAARLVQAPLKEPTTTDIIGHLATSVSQSVLPLPCSNAACGILKVW